MRFPRRISWNRFTSWHIFKSIDNFITGSWVLWGTPYFTSLKNFTLWFFFKRVNILHVIFYWLSLLATSLQTLLIRWLLQYPWASLSFARKTVNHFLKPQLLAHSVLSLIATLCKRAPPCLCRCPHCHLASTPSTALPMVLINLLVATFHEHPPVFATDCCHIWHYYLLYSRKWSSLGFPGILFSWLSSSRSNHSVSGFFLCCAPPTNSLVTYLKFSFFTLRSTGHFIHTHSFVYNLHVFWL